jgi:VWFA-related protein
MHSRIALPLLVLALASSGALSPSLCSAQQNTPPAASSATLHIQSREVILPVTVRDKHGALVTTLQKADFTLTEDSRPQVIKGFSHETNLPFRIGLLVDTSRSMSNVIQQVRTSTGKFIDLMLPAPPPESKDQAFLLHFDREVELLQDFTSSREKLHRELDDMSASRQERYEGTDSGTNNGGGNGSSNGGSNEDRPQRSRGGTQLYDAIYLASDELMKSKDGRKALVVFSDGGDRGSKVTLNEAVDAADKANLAIYTIFFKGEQQGNSNGFPGGHRGGGYPGGGGGYPGGGGGYPGGNGGGRRGSEPTSGNGVDGKKIMQQIADRTGGHAFEAKKKDDLDNIYKLIEEELRNQYLLTYTPDKVDTEGGFHKILLKANKDDLVVSTREGYFAPEGK